MARRLRKKRIAGAIVVLLVIVVIIGAVVTSCKRRSNSLNSNQSQQTGQSTQEGGDSGGNNNGAGTTDGQRAVWIQEMSAYISEYTGAGNIVSAATTTGEAGRTVYTVAYKGTTIDSCFAYAKQIGITGEWTEVVTDEEYTISRELDRYIVKMSCEPKAPKGYDLQITLEVK